MSVVGKSQGSSASTQLPTPSPTFADVAPLLGKIQDCSFALTVAKWLAKELHSSKSTILFKILGVFLLETVP